MGGVVPQRQSQDDRIDRSCQKNDGQVAEEQSNLLGPDFRGILIQWEGVTWDASESSEQSDLSPCSQIADWEKTGKQT